MNPNRTLDLNQLRDIVLRSQAEGQPLARDPNQTVVVDREGNLFLGPDRTPANGPLSQVHTGTFAATRAQRDRPVAERCLPSNTTWVDEDGMQGFLYTIRTELADDFTLFLFHDGSGYQCLVVSPDLVGRHDPHKLHLFPDGTLCWGEPMGIGMPTLESAFAKSVLWANGASVFLRANHFPFSINNR